MSTNHDRLFCFYFVFIWNGWIRKRAASIVITLRKNLTPISQARKILKNNTYITAGHIAKNRHMYISTEIHSAGDHTEVIYANIICNLNFFRIVDRGLITDAHITTKPLKPNTTQRLLI